MPAQAPLFSTLLHSEAETKDLARKLALCLHPGDVLLLEGPIGAGKSLFARALIQQLLPHPEDIPSPTFTLVQTYAADAFEIWHADLYRLTGPDEVVELGLTEAFEDAVCIVEWPDRLGDLRPANAATLQLAHEEQPGQRTLSVFADTQRWRDLFKDLLTHG